MSTDSYIVRNHANNPDAAESRRFVGQNEGLYGNKSNIRRESASGHLSALREYKKALIKQHQSALEKRCDKQARQCEWGVDRLDRGIELVRRYAREHQAAVSAGDAVQAQISASMMNEVKRQAIDEVHDKLEGNDYDFSGDRERRHRRRRHSADSVHSEDGPIELPYRRNRSKAHNRHSHRRGGDEQHYGSNDYDPYNSSGYWSHASDPYAPQYGYDPYAYQDPNQQYWQQYNGYYAHPMGAIPLQQQQSVSGYNPNPYANPYEQQQPAAAPVALADAGLALTQPQKPIAEPPPAEPANVKPELPKEQPKLNLLEELKIDDRKPTDDQTNAEKSPESLNEPPAEGENAEDDGEKKKKKCVVM